MNKTLDSSYFSPPFKYKSHSENNLTQYCSPNSSELVHILKIEENSRINQQCKSSLGTVLKTQLQGFIIDMNLSGDQAKQIREEIINNAKPIRLNLSSTRIIFSIRQKDVLRHKFTRNNKEKLFKTEKNEQVVTNIENHSIRPKFVENLRKTINNKFNILAPANKKIKDVKRFKFPVQRKIYVNNIKRNLIKNTSGDRKNNEMRKNTSETKINKEKLFRNVKIIIPKVFME